VFGATLLAVILAAALGLLQWKIDLPGHRIIQEVRDQAKLLLWFTWPAWPLAIWTLWRWRRQLTARHVALPLWFVVVPLLATWTTNFSERSLLLGLPAFATLAAFALPTFRRSVAALIDWFTLLFFSGSAITIWVIWIAMQTGVPAKPAANVAKLAPGFVPQLSVVAFIFAVTATLAWAWLVRWRTGRHRAALWKTLVLPAGGAALCWTLVMTLWLPVLDYARSYAPQVRAISERVGQPYCISELALDRPHIAALRHHGNFNVQPLLGGQACPWLLVGPVAIARLHEDVNLDGWRLIGTLRRPTSPADDLLLYQRIAPAGG
jgi:4-amino-4-deoxy-L-arabinose transferase-like glycosyltransferase